MILGTHRAAGHLFKDSSEKTPFTQQHTDSNPFRYTQNQILTTAQQCSFTNSLHMHRHHLWLMQHTSSQSWPMSLDGLYMLCLPLMRPFGNRNRISKEFQLRSVIGHRCYHAWSNSHSVITVIMPGQTHILPVYDTSSCGSPRPAEGASTPAPRVANSELDCTPRCHQRAQQC